MKSFKRRQGGGAPGDDEPRASCLLVNETLVSMERDFAGLFTGIERPLFAPDKLLRARLQVVYSGAITAPVDERSSSTCCFAGIAAPAN